MRTAAVLLALSSVAVAQSGSSAVYTVDFDATWSATTHPGAYPAGAHFSPLVGATHSTPGQFWQVGGVSSPGMEVMAETGSTSPLSTEINADILSGTAGELIIGGAISSPGSTSDTFTVTDEFPLLTLVTMIAPSPDWFVGVDGLDLRPGGVWVDQLVVDLYAYDAGTDSGPAFTSPNQDTNPQDPITLMTGGPFFGVTPLGTYTIQRVTSTNVYGCGTNPAGSLTVFSGLPSLGQTVMLALDDPTSQLGSPAATVLGISTSPLAGYPCGLTLPGLGLAGGGAAGELLISNPFLLVNGPAYGGTAVTIPIAVPSDPSLVSIAFYAQAALVGPEPRAGLTDAVELFVGP